MPGAAQVSQLADRHFFCCGGNGFAAEHVLEAWLFSVCKLRAKIHRL